MERPKIVVSPGSLPWLVDAAEKVIRENYRRWGLYRRGDLLQQVTVSTEDTDSPIRRPNGSVTLRVPPTIAIQDIFGRAIDWCREREDSKGNITQYPIDCPMKIAATYAARATWNLPILTGIVEAPVMRWDGTILIEQGYDERTELLLHSTERWSLPASTSRDAARAAAQVLLKVFSDFPMRDDAARSVIISAILTGIQRRELFSAPAHAFNKAVQGSGASLLADCVSLIVTGRPVVSTSYTPDRTEFEKKLAAILAAGDAIVNIDNVTEAMSSAALATILTLRKWQARILGLTRMVHLLTNVLFLIGGNQLEFMGDMTSRVVEAYIDPNCERP
jgi:putative DNA primase/helicase